MDMLEELKARVFAQNLALVKHGLVVLTWGNVSARDPESGLVVIKPSGVSYDTMQASDMVVVDLDGNVVEGSLRPSSDLPTHLYLYRAYPSLGGVVHTHSTYATAFAQSGRPIPPYGTTHADAFYGEVPCARGLTEEEINGAYEWNTGKVIGETVTDVDAIPAILVQNHGVFTWGHTPEKAVENAVTVEAVAQMALLTEQLRPGVPLIGQALLDKHYFRKHGKDAYYGQK
jgi:L-ribulose-5-phosphate 4-epimerase